MNIFNSLVKQYYQAGIYQKKNLPVFIQCGWITTDDYKSLTGEDYVVPTAS